MLGTIKGRVKLLLREGFCLPVLIKVHGVFCYATKKHQVNT